MCAALERTGPSVLRVRGQTAGDVMPFTADRLPLRLALITEGRERENSLLGAIGRSEKCQTGGCERASDLAPTLRPDVRVGSKSEELSLSNRLPGDEVGMSQTCH